MVKVFAVIGVLAIGITIFGVIGGWGIVLGTGVVATLVALKA